MPAVLSKRKIAIYAAEQIAKKSDSTERVLREIAAYLVETGKTRQAGLVVRNIEEELATRGIVIADVTTARPLSDEMQQAISKQIDGDVKLRTSVDPTVLGGVLLNLPGKQMDKTIKRNISALRAQKK